MPEDSAYIQTEDFCLVPPPPTGLIEGKKNGQCEDYVVLIRNKGKCPLNLKMGEPDPIAFTQKAVTGHKNSCTEIERAA